MNEAQKFISKQYYQKQRELIDDALATYGVVITKKEGDILTVAEMQAYFEKATTLEEPITNHSEA